MAPRIHLPGQAGSLAGRLVQFAAVGVAGDLVVRGASRLGPGLGPAVRRMAVGGLAQGIRLARSVERATEGARMVTGDLMAEARERLGEEAPPPVEARAAARAGGQNGHEH